MNFFCLWEDVAPLLQFDFGLLCVNHSLVADVCYWLPSQVTCKSVGSCILLLLVLLDVTELDSDERLLRAEEGRDDDLLSGAQSKRRIEKENVNKKHTCTYTKKNKTL